MKEARSTNGLKNCKDCNAEPPAFYHLTESAGADLPNQFKLLSLAESPRLRGEVEGVPSICVVFGNATAGGAYVPGMSDYAIFVKEQAKVFGWTTLEDGDWRGGGR